MIYCLSYCCCLPVVLGRQFLWCVLAVVLPVASDLVTGCLLFPPLFGCWWSCLVWCSVVWCFFFFFLFAVTSLDCYHAMWVIVAMVIVSSTFVCMFAQTSHFGVVFYTVALIYCITCLYHCYTVYVARVTILCFFCHSWESYPVREENYSCRQVMYCCACVWSQNQIWDVGKVWENITWEKQLLRENLNKSHC